MSYGLALSMRVLPLPVALWPEQNNATPSLQPHYRTFFTTTGCSAPVPLIGTLTLIGSTYWDFSLSIGATGSRVPHKSLVQGHAAFTPDAAWAAIRLPPRLVPGLEPRKTAEKALVTVIQEAWIGGVSTRRVDELVQAMGLSGISKSQVSKLCKDTDERVNAFLDRPIDG